MILIFDLFQTLVEDIRMDFNLGLKPLWNEHYKDKCSFDEIKAYGEELFIHMQDLHKQGLEFPFVKEELPMYAARFGGGVISMSIEDEAEFLCRCNEERVYEGLPEMLDLFAEKEIPMYVLSNSGFRAGALRLMLDSYGIGKYFKKVWSSADFGKVKPSADFFNMSIGEVLSQYSDATREDILFIGDTYETDIAGAHNAGLRTVWINRNNATDDNGFATYQIKDITELRKVHMDSMFMSLPGKIKTIIEGKSYTTDDIGRSGSKVLIFEDMVLKITDNSSVNKDEVEMMRWLEGKIPAPSVIAFEEDDSKSYLLMSRISGKMACDKYYLDHPEELVPLLAKAIKMLQSIDIKGCPIEKDLDRVLKRASYRVENGLVDISDAEPDTFGEKGRFKDPEELLSWLQANRPSYEPVLSHGDLCLPNILIMDGDISGFIDMGNCGIADKWEDIALCYRSLRHNFDGTYGKVYPGLDPESIFEELGIAPDRDKIDYYILLDELF